jgi:hypothetical protein
MIAMSGSVSRMFVRVTFPVFRTTNVYVILSPALSMPSPFWSTSVPAFSRSISGCCGSG